MRGEVDVKRVIDQFVRLVEIDSLSLGERQMADVLKVELESLGFEVTEDDAGSYYGSDTGNLYGLLKGTNPAKEPVLLSAHMDTVAPGIGKKAIVDREKGIITSAGDTVLGSDDLSGVVEILEAVRIAKEDPEGYGDIEVIFSVAEEAYCLGSAKFDYSRLRSNTAYVIDASGHAGEAARQAPSIISFELTIHGKSAHAGFAPETGINAIAAAAEIISGTPQGQVGNGLTVNIGTIEGGTSLNIVPDKVKFKGEVRSFDHEQAAAAISDLQKLAGEVCSAMGSKFEFSIIFMHYAYETPLEDSSCRTFLRACENLGLKGELVSTRIGSDNNIFALHDIRGIVVASGMINLHTTEEYIEIRDLEMVSRLLAEIIALS